MKGLIEYAKKHPGKLNYASNGVGSHPHVGMETIARRLGLQITHVPYKCLPTTDLMAGVVDLQLEASTTALPNIKAGKIKALATSGPERIPALPDLPTLTEIRGDLDPGALRATPGTPCSLQPVRRMQSSTASTRRSSIS